jgi:hypothetical protein
VNSHRRSRPPHRVPGRRGSKSASRPDATNTPLGSMWPRRRQPGTGRRIGTSLSCVRDQGWTVHRVAQGCPVAQPCARAGALVRRVRKQARHGARDVAGRRPLGRPPGALTLPKPPSMAGWRAHRRTPRALPEACRESVSTSGKRYRPVDRSRIPAYRRVCIKSGRAQNANAGTQIIHYGWLGFSVYQAATGSGLLKRSGPGACYCI